MRKRSNRKEMETEVKREQKCSERKTGRERGHVKRRKKGVKIM